MAKKTNQEIKELFERCSDNPTESALDEFSQALRSNESTLEEIGDLTTTNYLKLIQEMGHPPSQRILQAYIPKLKRDLNYNQSPRVVKLAIDGVILAWLRWQEHESIYTTKSGGRMPLHEAAFWDRRLSASQSRYLRAVTTLARVQKLARNDPAFQVNIALDGSQQVNIAGNYNNGGDQEKNGIDGDVIEGEVKSINQTNGNGQLLEGNQNGKTNEQGSGKTSR